MAENFLQRYLENICDAETSFFLFLALFEPVVMRFGPLKISKHLENGRC